MAPNPSPPSPPLSKAPWLNKEQVRLAGAGKPNLSVAQFRSRYSREQLSIKQLISGIVVEPIVRVVALRALQPQRYAR